MRVILMQTVDRLGEAGQQVDVADGYARNYLLPKQLAVPATPGRMKSLAQVSTQAKNREERTKREAAALAEKLAAVQLVLTRRASHEAAPASEESPTGGSGPAGDAPGGRLFGSVTGQDVSQALAAQGFSVNKKQILLPEPIKTLGVHRVPVRLHANILAELSVRVEREV